MNLIQTRPVYNFGVVKTLPDVSEGFGDAPETTTVFSSILMDLSVMNGRSGRACDNVWRRVYLRSNEKGHKNRLGTQLGHVWTHVALQQSRNRLPP